VEVAYVRDQGIVGSFDPHIVEQKGNAPAVVATDTVLEVKAPDSGQVTFAGPTGTLWLGRPSTFIGKVADFGAQESIDLPSIPSASTPCPGTRRTIRNDASFGELFCLLP
jgi:hypothetical protein